MNTHGLIRPAAILVAVCGLCFAASAASADPFEYQKLFAADGDSGDVFGAAVAIDGDRAVVGAWHNNGFQGAAYVFVRGAGAWQQQAKLVPNRVASNFGTSVAIDGDSILVGAPGTGEAAYVYTLQQGAWRLQAQLVADNLSADVAFGWSVALEGNTAVVAARNEGNRGAVYVFGRAGTTWSRQAKLATDSDLSDDFGYSVAISGDTILVGSRLDDDKDPDAGSAFVFERSDGAWRQQAKLLPDGPYAGFVHFGYSVAIDGNTAVVGAWRDRQVGPFSGAAYVFERSGSNWSRKAKLLPPDNLEGGAFGNSVGISGDRLVVGEEDRVLEVTPDRVVRTGAAYLFTRSDGTWSNRTMLLPDAVVPGDRFGNAVAIDGETVLAGAYTDNTLGEHAGAAYAIDLTPAARPILRCTANLTGPGTAGLVLVRPGGLVQVRDLAGNRISEFKLSSLTSVVDAELIGDVNGNGVPDLAVLGSTPAGIEVRDLWTGNLLDSRGLSAIGAPVDLEVLADRTGNGIAETAVLGRDPVNVDVSDPVTGTGVATLDYDSYLTPKDLAVYPDLDGDGAPELVVLGENRQPDGADKLELRNLASGEKLYDIWLGGGWQVLEQALLTDMNGNGTPEAAVLRVPNAGGKVTVLLRDSVTRRWLGTQYFDPNYPPIRLRVIADINGNGADEVVVFGQRFNQGNQKAQIMDAVTHAMVNVVFFDKNYHGRDLAVCADLNGNGAEELAMLGERRDGALKVVVKDARSNERLGAVRF